MFLQTHTSNTTQYICISKTNNRQTNKNLTGQDLHRITAQTLHKHKHGQHQTMQHIKTKTQTISGRHIQSQQTKHKPTHRNTSQQKQHTTKHQTQTIIKQNQRQYI